MADNRDSGLTEESSGTTASDILMRSSSGVTGSAISNKSNGSAVVMRKSAINNSLLDLTDASEKMARRGSVGSLDSGMSISFQSNSIFNNHQCSQNYRSPRLEDLNFIPILCFKSVLIFYCDRLGQIYIDQKKKQEQKIVFSLV